MFLFKRRPNCFETPSTSANNLFVAALLVVIKSSAQYILRTGSLLGFLLWYAVSKFKATSLSTTDISNTVAIVVIVAIVVAVAVAVAPDGGGGGGGGVAGGTHQQLLIL